MAKRKNKKSQSRPIWLTLIGLVGLGLLVAKMLVGKDVAIFNPKGSVAQAELNLMLISVALMLLIAIPTLILLYSFAWKYRESNHKSVYDPYARQSKFFELNMWVLPTIFMVLLASVMWPATHRLEPKKTIAADAKPINIQVVALRWKWLFIYPEHNIATVNFVQVPVHTPIQFDLTADEAPMSSFWVPHLGGQLYAMTGHVNRLNLIADVPGDYPGSTAEINGPGFAGMKFTARATSSNDFDLWVEDMQESSGALDAAEYAKLLRPSEKNAAAFYSPVKDDPYDKILLKYMGSHDHQPSKYEAGH